MTEAQNLTRKILAEHLSGGELAPGEEIGLSVDQILIEDATGSMTALQFEALGADRVAVPLAVMYVDHNVLQIDDKNMDEHRYLRSVSARYGILYSRPGNGISHHARRGARLGAVERHHPRAFEALRGARGPGEGIRVYGGRCRRPVRHRAGHDLQHDHGAGRHRRRLPFRRASARVARSTATRG